MSESALSGDWKLDTFKLIKEDHYRRGIPYFTSGTERDVRAKEAHGEISISKNVIVGVSDCSSEVDNVI